MYNALFWYSLFFALVATFIIAWNKTSDRNYQIPEWETIFAHYMAFMTGSVVGHFLYKWW